MAAFMNQTVVLARPQDSIDQAAAELDKFVIADNNYDDLSKRLRVYSERKYDHLPGYVGGLMGLRHILCVYLFVVGRFKLHYP